MGDEDPDAQERSFWTEHFLAPVATAIVVALLVGAASSFTAAYVTINTLETRFSAMNERVTALEEQQEKSRQLNERIARLEEKLDAIISRMDRDYNQRQRGPK